MKNHRKTVKTLADLTESQLVSEQDLPSLQKVVSQFNVAITPSIIDLIDPMREGDPIAAQFVPDVRELNLSPKELADPIGDTLHEKVTGVIHRYPDRCLLKVINVCPVYCRFCFRKEMLGPGKASLTESDLEKAYDYIRQHPDIWEVILTGGDPLLLKPKRLGQIIQALSNIPHVEVIRIHTRIPIVDPARVTEQLLVALKIPKALYIVLHANHPSEFSEAAIKACGDIVDNGIPMLSQSVLLKNVNADPVTLKQLMKTFVRHRIKPYYLHHPDLVKGTEHFRVSVTEGQALVKSLHGHISGLCQPRYVLDIPGGAGKVPIGPCYAQPIHQQWQLEDYQGGVHFYEF